MTKHEMEQEGVKMELGRKDELIETLEEDSPPVSVPVNRICPFLSTSDRMVECLRERCGIWVINECALVRITKSRQTF